MVTSFRLDRSNGPGITKPGSDPVEPSGDRYQVVGTRIYDPDGELFYPFGANTAVKHTSYSYVFEWEPWNSDTISGYDPPGGANFPAHITAAAQWGWNFLRINTVPWNDAAGGPQPGGDPSLSFDQMQPGIQQLLDAGFVVMVTSHYPSPGSNPVWGSTEDLRIREFWTQALTYYADEPKFWINPYNEPFGGGGSAGVAAQTAFYANWITFLRGLGYTGPLVFDISRYAQGIDDVALGYYDAFMELDDNMILGWHAYGVITGESSALGYPAWSVTKEACAAMATAAHARGHCILIGEFGQTIDGSTVTGSVAGQENVVDWALNDSGAQNLDIGMCAWHAGHGAYSLMERAPTYPQYGIGPFWNYTEISPNGDWVYQTNDRSPFGVMYWDKGVELGVGIGGSGGSGSAGLVKGFDATQSITSQAFFNGMYAKGYRVYVLNIATWPEPGDPTSNSLWNRAEAQIDMAFEAGLYVGAYTRNPQDWILLNSLPTASRAKLAFFALDIETEGYNGEAGQHPTQAMIDGIRALDICPIIYSGYGMWDEMNVVGDWSQVKLWNTSGWLRVGQSEAATVFEYTEPFVAFGGWDSQAECIAEQLTFETTVTASGVSVAVDLNVWDGDWLEGAYTQRGIY